MSRRVALGLVHLVVALVVGVGAGVGAVAWLDERRSSAIAEEARAVADLEAELERRSRPGANDVLDAAVDELLRDGVHVTADGRSMLGTDAEAEVEAAFAGAPVRMLAVVWAQGQSVGLSRVQLHDALEQRVRDRIGDERAWLFVWEGPQEGTEVMLPASGYVTGFSISDFAGDPATFLVDAARTVTTDDFYEVRDDADDDEWGGRVGGGLLGLLLGGAIIAVTLVAARIAAAARGRRRLLPGRWGWGAETPTPTRRNSKR
ncbi:hypothetical protein ABFT23_20630 [Nocardioides sp. C4-1]|uniref:hypothetical protein n=1 Tax=Nocardioides sp. C4-1 TaxID=3151851 RepID=UPI00326601AA